MMLGQKIKPYCQFLTIRKAVFSIFEKAKAGD